MILRPQVFIITIIIIIIIIIVVVVVVVVVNEILSVFLKLKGIQIA
jgi:hypothetical protein